MKTTSLLAEFENLPYFTLAGYRQLLEERSPGARHAAVTLHRWVQAGKVIQLKKGVYMARRFYERHAVDEDFLPAVSAILLPQSYLSLEFVLQRGGVLTEVTYPVTAVTLKNTRSMENPLGTFVYSHIQPGLYRGFVLRDYLGIPFARASLPKALFDYLYLRPLPAAVRQKGYSLAEDLRLNLEDFSTADRDEFSGYAAASGLPKMALIDRNLWRTVWRV